MVFKFYATALLGLICHAVSAEISTQCPKTNVCFSLSIPASTASTGKGSIYFRLQGPSTYRWLAIGQGSQMNNANYFVVYSSSDGNNITLSPRHTSGHDMPTYNNAAQVTLLAGSGVVNGTLLANIKCSNCDSWSGGQMKFSSSSTQWIWGYNSKSKTTLQSDDVSVAIPQHDNNGYGKMTFSSSVIGGSDVNPFAQGNLTSSSSPVNGTSGSISSSTASNDGDSSDLVISFHGVLAGLAFVIIFPLGGILIRMCEFSGLLWIHGILQLFGYVVYIVAAGLGIYSITHGNSDIASDKHAIIGYILLIALFLQGPLGWFHHKRFVSKGHRTIPSYLHLWIARLSITLGFINGIFGLLLTNSNSAKIVAYGIVGGMFWLCYCAAVILGERRRSRNQLNNSGYTSAGPQDHAMGNLLPVSRHQIA